MAKKKMNPKKKKMLKKKTKAKAKGRIGRKPRSAQENLAAD